MKFNTYYKRLTALEKEIFARKLKISKSYADAIVSGRVVPSDRMKDLITITTKLTFNKK